MKMIYLTSVLLLTGCGITYDEIPAIGVGATAVGVAVTAGSVVAIQRTPGDALFSWLTGRDCSIVRLDQGKTYCRPVEPEPEPPPYCTRSLGSVNCWKDPDTVPGHPRGVADGPTTLTPEQEANRVRTWP
jgi:hypothetical protein